MNQQANAIDPASPEANAVQPQPEVDVRQGYPQVVETDATPGATPPASVPGETPETPVEPQTPVESVVTPPATPQTLRASSCLPRSHRVAVVGRVGGRPGVCREPCEYTSRRVLTA